MRFIEIPVNLIGLQQVASEFPVQVLVDLARRLPEIIQFALKSQTMHVIDGTTQRDNRRIVPQ
jgi:hypothetical protein